MASGASGESHLQSSNPTVSYPVFNFDTRRVEPRFSAAFSMPRVSHSRGLEGYTDGYRRERRDRAFLSHRGRGFRFGPASRVRRTRAHARALSRGHEGFCPAAPWSPPLHGLAFQSLSARFPSPSPSPGAERSAWWWATGRRGPWRTAVDGVRDGWWCGAGRSGGTPVWPETLRPNKCFGRMRRFFFHFRIKGRRSATDSVGQEFSSPEGAIRFAGELREDVPDGVSVEVRTDDGELAAVVPTDDDPDQSPP